MDYIKREKEWENIAKEAYKAQKRRKEYEMLEKKLLEQLKFLSENESSESKNFRYQKIERKGSILYSKIPQLQGIDLEPYRKEGLTTSWKLFKY